MLNLLNLNVNETVTNESGTWQEMTWETQVREFTLRGFTFRAEFTVSRLRTAFSCNWVLRQMESANRGCQWASFRTVATELETVEDVRRAVGHFLFNHTNDDNSRWTWRGESDD